MFLISVGIGYLSALVQLHFQHATPGAVLPTPEDAETHLLTAPRAEAHQQARACCSRPTEKLPFNGSGQMSPAFTTRSRPAWKSKIKEKAKELIDHKEHGELDRAAEGERPCRRSATASGWPWSTGSRSGASKAEYKRIAIALPEPWPTSRSPRSTSSSRTASPSNRGRSRSSPSSRTLRPLPQPEGEDGQAAQFPLDNYETARSHTWPCETSSGMSLTKLAQTTHVHLLGFSMLYGLTGLILAFSSYPRLLRVILCPLPLLAQVVDISFWWLARLDDPYGPQFAARHRSQRRRRRRQPGPADRPEPVQPVRRQGEARPRPPRRRLWARSPRRQGEGDRPLHGPGGQTRRRAGMSDDIPLAPCLSGARGRENHTGFVYQ